MNLKKITQLSAKMFAFVLSIVVSTSVIAATPPSQVENVKAEIINETSINLSWDEAQSEEGIIVGYKIYFGKVSVKNEGESYTDEIEVESRTLYPMENLSPGTRYYFALTALDDELNQSVNYSEEIFIDLPGTAPSISQIIQTIEDPVIIEEEVVQEIVNQPEIIEEPRNASAPLDIMAPIDASNVLVDTSRLKESDSVSLRWQKSVDLDGDAVDQMVYVKKGNGNWDNGYSVGKDLEEMVLDVEQDQNYQVRIVTLDTEGNSSIGITVSFSTETLAESGPGMLIPLGIVAIAMFFFLSFRRKS